MRVMIKKSDNYINFRIILYIDFTLIISINYDKPN